MSKKKEKVIPVSMLPFTSDNGDHLKRLLVMCEGLILHHYMGLGSNFDMVRAVVVETKDLESFGIIEVEEYVKMVKSYGLKYAVQFEIVFPMKEGDVDDL